MSVSDDGEDPSPLGRSLLVTPDGEAVVHLDGDLDIVSAEEAFDYVSDVIDRCRGPVVLDLSAVKHCDAHGLRALARLCHYAGQSNCLFQLTSPSDRLIEITLIAGFDLKFTEF